MFNTLSKVLDKHTNRGGWLSTFLHTASTHTHTHNIFAVTQAPLEMCFILFYPSKTSALVRHRQKKLMITCLTSQGPAACLSLLHRPRTLDEWQASRQLRALAAFAELQVTGISSVIKWTWWSMTCLVGTLGLLPTALVWEITFHHITFIKALSNHIGSHPQVITSPNKRWYKEYNL